MQHDYSFDPTYGYSLDTLLQVGSPPEPEDYERFWRDTYARTLATPPRPTLKRIDPIGDYEAFEIEYDGLDGFRVGGWITVPKHAESVRGVVVGHGYGGRSEATPNLPGPPAVSIFPCGRGFHRSARADLPNTGHQHVLVGIESRDTYLHRGCITDMWSAASALIELHPQLASHVHYVGGSFGGGIGAMALPWEPRFKRAFLDVPSFGNHPVRVECECGGSGQSIQRLWRTKPAILDVLRYYDATLAARHTTTPTFVAAAVFDPAVPPPGQFAVYNCLAGEKRLFVREAAHFTWPGQGDEDKRLNAELEQWFNEG